MASQEVQHSPGTIPRFFYGYIVVAAGLCIMVVGWGIYFAFGVFFKPVLTELSWTRAMTSGAFSLATIVQGLLCIVMGRLTDRLGPRIVLTLCGFLLGLGYLLMSLMGAIWQLYLFYGVIIGIGMSGVIVPINSTIARWFVTRRSMMTGIFASGTGIGVLIAAPVATRLISTYDWRISYIIVGIISLVIVVLAAQFLRRDPAQMGLMPYGQGTAREQEERFGAVEFSLSEAVYTRQFWLLFIMSFGFGFGTFTTMVHFAPHATDIGISVANAANIMAVIGVGSIIGKVVMGTAADRIGNKLAFIISFILMSAAYFWLVPATEVWMLYLFAFFFGIAFGGCSSSHSPLVAKLFGLSSHGLIFGIMYLSVTIGGAAGPFLAGYIFDVTGSYQMAFLICAAIGIVGLISTIVLKPTRSEFGKNGQTHTL